MPKNWKRGLKLTSKKGLNEADWQKLRASFSSSGKIGGSDAGAVLGIDDYRSAAHVFYDCLGLGYFPRQLNEIMLHGKELEAYVAKMWTYHDGEGVVSNYEAGNPVNRFRVCNDIIENPKYRSLFANIDYEIRQHHRLGKLPGVLEIKTISAEVSDKYELGFPPKYLAQVQLYLLITELSWGELCWFNVGRRRVEKTIIYPDKDMQQAILEAANRMMDSVALAAAEIEAQFGGEPVDIQLARQIASFYEPGPQPGYAYQEFLSARHRVNEYNTEMEADSKACEDLEDLIAAREQLNTAEERKVFAENRIKKYMQDNSANVLLFPGNRKITWNKQFRLTV